MDKTPVQDEIDLWDLVIPVWKHKAKFAGVCALCVIIAIIYALTATKYYKANATIMPMDTPQSSGMLSSLMGSFMPGLGGVGGGSTANTMMAILKSRHMAEIVVGELKDEIYPALYPKKWDMNGKTWKVSGTAIPTQEQIMNDFQKTMSASLGKDKQTLEISSTQTKPELTKKIVDEYLNQLNLLLNQKDLTVAQRNKTFLEGQLLKNKQKLLEDAKTISDFYKKFQVPDQNNAITINLDEDTSIPSTTSLSDQKTQPASDHVVKNLSANQYLDYLTSRQQVMKLANSTLEQQYLIASIEAEKNKLGFYVIDQPQVPIKRFKPARRQIVMMSSVLGIFLGFIFCHVFEFWQKNKSELKRRLNAA